jgi:starch synthase
MNILIASSEAVPYAKTGGLADVCGALLKEFRARKGNACIMLPLYRKIREGFAVHDTGKTVRVPVGTGILEGRIFASGKSPNPEAYFIACDPLYDRPDLYGTPEGDYSDNAVRFIFFSRAVLDACLTLGISPDIIHCNDWQTGMIPLYLKTLYRSHKVFRQTAALFTIHNLGYQGNFDPSYMIYTGLGWDQFTPERLEFYGKMSLMKAGLLGADLISTVSETYAQEILEPENGFGLDGVLRKRKHDLFGIINGIDTDAWNPARDPFLPSGFGLKNQEGKAACKDRLREKTGLKGQSAPLAGIVSRLSDQKGLDLVVKAMDELASLGLNIVVLGKGEEYYHRALADRAKRHRGRISVTIGFEEPLAHLIYAGSDFFLMPSQYEPCGLGQMIALRYGSVPVARRTGGLADTIVDYDHLAGKGTGFLFRDYTPGAFLDAVKRALCVYSDRSRLASLVRRSMQQDFSWGRSAEKYLELYRRAKERARR